MPKGTVKWFNPTKRFGFIEQEAEGNDIFVHMTAVEASGLESLHEGQAVEYEVETDQSGKAAAINLSVIYA